MTTQVTEDVARRAMQLYDEQLRERLEKTHNNAFVAIEPDSGEFFFGKTLSEAIQASRSAYPDRLAFGIRVGHSAAVHLGALIT